MKNYFRLILAIFLIPAASSAVSADRPYPTFTSSDLVQCRAEISKFQQAVAKWWGKKDQKAASATLREDPISWFAAGPGNGCAEAWECWGGSTDDSSSNFKNPDENLDAINAMAKGESKMSPDEMLPYQIAADKCVAKAWLAKWQGAKSSAPSTNKDRPSQAIKISANGVTLTKIANPDIGDYDTKMCYIVEAKNPSKNKPMALYLDLAFEQTEGNAMKGTTGWSGEARFYSNARQTVVASGATRIFSVADFFNLSSNLTPGGGSYNWSIQKDSIRCDALTVKFNSPPKWVPADMRSEFTR